MLLHTTWHMCLHALMAVHSTCVNSSSAVYGTQYEQCASANLFRVLAVKICCGLANTGALHATLAGPPLPQLPCYWAVSVLNDAAMAATAADKAVGLPLQNLSSSTAGPMPPRADPSCCTSCRMSADLASAVPAAAAVGVAPLGSRNRGLRGCAAVVPWLGRCMRPLVVLWGLVDVTMAAWKMLASAGFCCAAD